MDWETGLVAAAFSIVSVAWNFFIMVLAVIVAWRWLHRPGGAAAQRARVATPAEILAFRYARGEIDEAELTARLHTLAESGF